ncbi:carboxymuconolactone decarboxylase family protein [Haloglomus litoreum]|uniref:carboxymuconolactone decarboxylase family protein n=1 Tax=Haloglomus litoreum TaxID=3034026 RepID=UPI0023E8B219|nr:hypothetical protein [Haloglomus sp. DT116]
MPLIDYVTDHDEDGVYEKRSLYTEVRMHNPAVVRAQTAYFERLLEAGIVDAELYDYIVAAIAPINRSAYCAASHRENLATMRDVPEETVAALREGDYGALDEFERTVVEFAVQVVRDPKAVDEADIERLYEVGFEDSDVVQLLALIGDGATANLFNAALDVDPADRDDDLPTF